MVCMDLFGSIFCYIETVSDVNIFVPGGNGIFTLSGTIFCSYPGWVLGGEA